MQRLSSLFFRFVLLGLLFTVTPGFSQTVGEQTFSAKIGTPLISLVEQVESKTNVKFYFKEEWVDSLKFTRDYNEVPLKAILETELKVAGLSVVINNETEYILIKNMLANRGKSNLQSDSINYANEFLIGDPMLAGKYRKAKIHGKILDGKNDEPLAGAIVYSSSRNQGTVTDANGNFLMELPVGTDELKVSYVSYEPIMVKINLISEGNLSIELFDQTTQLDQVFVFGNNSDIVKSDIGSVQLSGKNLDAIPTFMGESNIIKSLTLMPGIQSSGDLSSGLNVRGGKTDQNLVLIGGAPIYNSSHLMGMYSVIDTKIIESIELYKGSAPADFGGRLSSVMDINLGDGDFTQTSIDLSAGLFHSKASVNGPIIKDKFSYFISGRGSYTKPLLSFVPDPEINKSAVNYSDGMVKLSLKPNQKTYISLLGYYGQDNFDIQGQNLIKKQNNLYSGEFRRNIAPHLSLSAIAYYTDDKNTVVDNEDETSAYSIESGIQQVGINTKAIYLLNSNITLEPGIELNKYVFNLGERNVYGSSSTISELKLEPENAFDYSGYLNSRIILFRIVKLNLGGRFTNYTSFGPNTVYTYREGSPMNMGSRTDTLYFTRKDKLSKYGNFEPRLGLNIDLNGKTSIKMNYSKTYQYFHLISNSSVATPTDVWKSSDKYIKPQVGHQVAFGLFRSFGNKAYETSIEGFYKKASNQLEYKNGANLVLNETLEEAIINAKSFGYGVEFYLKKNYGNLSGWISYTYSRSFTQTPDEFAEETINRGEVFPSNTDKPHDLTLLMSYKISRKLTFSSTFSYITGKPVTYPERKYPVKGTVVVVFSDRNKYRLPDYHRLDVSLTYKPNIRTTKKWNSSLNFSIFNVYSRHNVYSVFFKKETPSELNDYNTYSLYKLVIFGTPVPSLTYNVWF